MPNVKRGVNPLIASFRRQMIDEIIADERQKAKTMTQVRSFKAQMMYGQIAIELEVLAEDDNGMTPDEIKSACDSFIEHGFTPRTFSRAGSGEKLDKLGTVTSITPVAGTKMFEVTGKLDDGAGDFKWREFHASTFRVNDRFKVIKNDRGFMAGQLIIDDGEQQQMAF